MPQRAAQILAQIKVAQKKNRRGVIQTLFVFAHEDGTQILRQNKGFKAAVRRANEANLKAKKADKIIFVPELSWHDLRRTAGCRWLQRDGRSMEEVSRMLGHSSIQVTEKHYAFLDEERVAENIAAQKQAHRLVVRTKIKSKNNG